MVQQRSRGELSMVRRLPFSVLVPATQRAIRLSQVAHGSGMWVFQLYWRRSGSYENGGPSGGRSSYAPTYMLCSMVINATAVAGCPPVAHSSVGKIEVGKIEARTGEACSDHHLVVIYCHMRL